MTIRLLPRKRFGKLIANSKGFSSVIGTTFMVLVMLFMSTSVFMWTLSQNTRYNEAVRAKNQEEADRRNEGVAVLGGNYSVSGDAVTVNVLLKNTGSVAVGLINLWVFNTDPSNRRYANKSLNLNLNPGDVINLLGSGELTVILLGANSSHEFVSWFVTARGNTVPLEKEEEGIIIHADVAQGIGAMALDFDRFRYFTFESPNKLADYPNGTTSFDIPKNTYVAFGCYLTNVDPLERTIIIDSHSLFWQPGRSGVAEGYWFIVNVEANGTINDAYSPIIWYHLETKMLVFASDDDLGTGSFSRKRTPNAETTVATFILLHGSAGPSAFAQNIPFVSLFYC